MQPPEREPRIQPEDPQSILTELLQGFNAEQQTVTIGQTEVSLAIPNCGPCQAEEIQPSAEHEGSYLLRFTWPGTHFYFSAAVDNEGRLFVQMRSNRGESFSSAVVTHQGETSAVALLQALRRFMESPWIIEQSPSAEA